ncbi:MAG: DUF4982 domain-containing protein [Bacteroidetes bacterium]|nr:DUF4982 domain-containing protein [Bacteroidota bacterium]
MRWGLLVLLLWAAGAGAQPVRRDILLDDGWKTSMDSAEWKAVAVPHNWDDYGGYRRLRHGNLHGVAWYQRNLQVGVVEPGKRYFLFFEGVGSYATVWVNGVPVGRHAGGRTTFTLDVSGVLRAGKNLIVVRADHPAFIRDLPWVCGGCSDDRGFSEGSQPMGIFRPVHLVVTNATRVAPFGVHVWNDTALRVYVETEVVGRGAVVVTRLKDRSGGTVRVVSTVSGGTGPVKQEMEGRGLRLWSLNDPYLYTLVTELVVAGKVVDRVKNEFGLRVVKWSGSRLLLNGKPVFINGIAEYEHRMGASHAFSEEEIKARVGQIRAAGFNAFRDAHQPHNLRYQHYWDSLGILWWPQLSAHIWYDTPEFRKNFKTGLCEWIRERRNSPSVILWGLQNESKLPEDFARECVAIIRELDPTSVDQRKVTTCNGGTGTDWDVPQNWTGTYGGNPATYGADLKRQVLVGEYGGWRTIGLHGDVPNSEDRLDRLMEQKIRLADSVADSVAGHFAWLYASHDNPGRVQSGEGFREMDRIGPVNYKGLMTSWEEPTDLYYLYRSNFGEGPMVYIVSHTWPDRWTEPGRKDGIEVYSNCEEVELFNDIGGRSFGRRRRGRVGTHFQWDGVDIRYNVLYAVGYVRGKAVAKDIVVLHHLPRAPHLTRAGMITAPAAGYNYLYRVNCGGGDYTDGRGGRWMADRHYDGRGWGSVSWTDDYPGMPAMFASQRTAPCEPIRGTEDWPLFRDFRYGLEKLGYTFPVQDGDYRVELYFAEPWLGRGGGMDCTGWRVFDVAVNGDTVLKDLDIWKEAGYCGALKKVVNVRVKGGRLVISFPEVKSGQAVIAAIAVASRDAGVKAWPPAAGLIEGVDARYWLDTGDSIYDGEGVKFSRLAPELYGAEWVRGRRGDSVRFRVREAADVFDTSGMKGRRRFPAGAEVVAVAPVIVKPVTAIEPAYDVKPVVKYRAVDPVWTISVGVGDMYSLTVKYRVAAPAIGKFGIRMEDGTLIKEEEVRLPATAAGKWNYFTTSTGTMINAGKYVVKFVCAACTVDELQVQ